jgi:hypothetical protein
MVRIFLILRGKIAYGTKVVLLGYWGAKARVSWYLVGFASVYLVFLVPPQAGSHLHNMYTEALPFALAQSPSLGAKSKQGKSFTP